MEACPMAGMLPGGVVVVCSSMVCLSEFWLDVRNHHCRRHRCRRHQQLQQHLVSLCRKGFLCQTRYSGVCKGTGVRVIQIEVKRS